MNFIDKKKNLVSIITNTLIPLIDNDIVLMDVPYYANIGDILIWEGTLQFIKQYLKKHKLLYICSKETCSYPRLNKKTIILLQGGGNFGDLWYEFQQFRKEVIKKYPDNKIIILPQTIYYENEEKIKDDALLFSRHNNLVICLRDEISYEIARKYFAANTLRLVPDMAFCIQNNWKKDNRTKKKDKTLFFKRVDKELNNKIDYHKYIVEKKYDIYDWPTKEKNIIIIYFLRFFLKGNRIIPVLFRTITDIYGLYIFRSIMIKIGVNFIKKYDKIYTTRLHAAILCCLLEKPFMFFDNSYGKNSNFYKTWLSDLDEIKFIGANYG
jgi:pyruvyl transferase EpsO